MRCPACGNENREGARFCDSCGTPLAAPAPVGADERDPGPAPRDSAATANVPPGTPAEIGSHYEIAGFLGRGGRKTVYLARDREADGREVAIALFETAGIGETAAARARREAQAMERLGQHPRIVSVIASGEHDGAPFLVSEYMPGGNLGAILAGSDGGRIGFQQAIEIATDICRALEHAHGHGIVHRDLKPANVWIDDDGRARLGDFGLAATERRSREAGEGTLIGTVAYLPPEQALGRPVDARADLYSLGAILYEMVTGQPPFTGDDAIAVISRHVSSQPVPPRRHVEAIPAALDRLVLRLLAKSPDERPSSAAAVRADLEQIAADPDAAIEVTETEPAPEEIVAGALVGRERELEQIRAAVEDARAGHGGILLLVGEPGIGKTRAAEELSTYARIRGMRVLWGRCHEGDRAPAFWPWTEAIRNFVRDSDPVGLRWQLGPRGPDLARIVPDVAELLGIDVQAAEEEDQDRFRLFDSVAGFLIDASRSRPLVLVLDDLHWADASSLELLRYLAGQLADSGLLLVGAYRDVELGHQHSPSAVLAGLTAAAHARTIHLDGLDEDGVGAMIEASTGIVVPRTLVRSVWERTEGNPFFVGEIVRMLAAERRLSASTTELPVVIPHGAREAVTMRLHALGPDARRILRIAAVAGREFEPAAVEAASAEDSTVVAEALSEALDARLISENATARGDWLSFAHAIVRETLYAEIPADERASIHRRLGDAIERLHSSELDRFLDDLARHHIAGASGGDPAKAIEYACRAGERALASLAFEDAGAHYGRALELARASEEVDGERTLELTLSRGRALQLAGRPLEARKEFEEAARLARERDDVEALSAAALGISRVAIIGIVDEALLALLDEALARCDAGDSVARVELLAAKAQAEVWRDPQGAAQEAGTEALAIARRLADDHALAVALAIQQALTTARPEASRRRLENAVELIEVAERAGDGELLVRGHAFRLHSLLELGEVQAAESDALPAYRRVAEELRQPQHLWPLPLFRAMRATMEGRFEQAEAFAAEARREGERAQEPLAGQLHALQIAVIRELQGRLEEALPAVREMARNFPAIPAWRMTLASFLAELGNGEEARPEFERFARDGFSSVPRDLQWLPAMVRLADAAYWLDDAERAAILHAELEPFAGLAVMVGRAASCQGPVDLYLARVAMTMGRPSEAVAHFEAAAALARRMGDLPYLYESRHGLGRALATRSRPGDRERALAELTASLDGAEAIGMRRLLERSLVARLEVQGLADIDVLTSIEAVVEAVGSEHPDLSALARGDGTVTILFSDIENSTLINERLGDERWLEVLREHNRIFRSRLGEHGGYEVKSQGDGFMLAFAEPADALEFAIAVQGELAESAAAGAEGTSVRMGMHTGVAIAEGGDLFGRSVVLAARIAAQALGGEILVSEPLAESCTRAGDGMYSFDAGRELELKGLSGTHRVFRVELEQGEEAAALSAAAG